MKHFIDPCKNNYILISGGYLTGYSDPAQKDPEINLKPGSQNPIGKLAIQPNLYPFLITIAQCNIFSQNHLSTQ